MAENIATWASAESVSLNYCMEEAQLLGRGKFSVVHHTTRRSDGRPVALKRIQVCAWPAVVRPWLADALDPLDRQVFDMGSNERDECMNEIRLLQSMHHPHIIDYLSCVIEHNELTGQAASDGGEEGGGEGGVAVPGSLAERCAAAADAAEPDRLVRLLLYLREVHLYCYFCASRFSSAEEIEACCPGVLESAHEGDEGGGGDRARRR